MFQVGIAGFFGQIEHRAEVGLATVDRLPSGEFAIQGGFAAVHFGGCFWVFPKVRLRNLVFVPR